MVGKAIPILTAVMLMGLLTSQGQIIPAQNLTTAQFKTTLYTFFDLSVADGNTVVFDPAYSNSVDGNDVPKIPNPSENFGILRDGIVLIIEGRQPIVDKDTIFFKMWNMTTQAYQLEFTPTGFSPGTTALLQDNYLGTNTPISLITTSTIVFSINGDPASSATDRFRVVFNTIVVPLSFLNLTASQVLQEVRLDWEMANETEVDHYEAERSLDGISFNKISSNVLPKGILKYSCNDANPFPGANFYRIKAIDKSGKAKYTGIVKVLFGNNIHSITVSPNPIIGNDINIHFLNEQRGVYDIHLYNATGQLLCNRKVVHQGGSSIYFLSLTNKLSSGVYYINTYLTGNKITTEKIIIR